MALGPVKSDNVKATEEDLFIRDVHEWEKVIDAQFEHGDAGVNGSFGFYLNHLPLRYLPKLTQEIRLALIELYTLEAVGWKEVVWWEDRVEFFSHPRS